MKSVFKVGLNAIRMKQTLPIIRHSPIMFFPKQNYNFSANNQIDHKQALSQINMTLSNIKFEDGKTLIDNKYIVDLQLDSQFNLKILIKLERNFVKVRQLIMNELKQLEWLQHVSIKLAPQQKEVEKRMNHKGGLQEVQNIVAVSSCKGGVGKSTVSINLACKLEKLGYKVGIFDADIYGPSLPTLISKEKETLEKDPENPQQIKPVLYNSLKTMSFGYTQQQSAILRGPMISQLILQLLFQTKWGHLDYLIIDMPPGTGDIQITLCQELKINSSVIVTTPQKLSFVDVVKGIEMFDKMEVKVVSVVNNMSYYQHQCGNCGHFENIYLFGQGYMGLLKKQLGIEGSVDIPISQEISKYSDNGTPIVHIFEDDHFINQQYHHLANTVVSETKQSKPPIVRYNAQSKCLILQENSDDNQDPKVIKKINARTLRYFCGCALCTDEFTGQKLIKIEDIREDVFPTKIENKGNYAVAVIWSDGHKSSIYPFKTLMSQTIPEHKE